MTTVLPTVEAAKTELAERLARGESLEQALEATAASDTQAALAEAHAHLRAVAEERVLQDIAEREAAERDKAN